MQLDVISLGTMRTCVFAFTRMNPPHLGHEALVKKTEEIARALKGEQRIYLSSVQRPTLDPLPLDRKLMWAKASFPNNIFLPAIGEGIEPVETITHLYNEGFQHFCIVCGSDRISFFKNIMATLSKKGIVDFPVVSMSVISRTEENIDPFTERGLNNRLVSGTYLRSLVSENNFERFSLATSKHLKSDEKMMLFEEIKRNI